MKYMQVTESKSHPLVNDIYAETLYSEHVDNQDETELAAGFKMATCEGRASRDANTGKLDFLLELQLLAFSSHCSV